MVDLPEDGEAARMVAIYCPERLNSKILSAALV